MVHTIVRTVPTLYGDEVQLKQSSLKRSVALAWIPCLGLSSALPYVPFLVQVGTFFQIPLRISKTTLPSFLPSTLISTP